MARVILALEIDEDEGFYNETTTGTVLGYLEPFSGEPRSGERIFLLVEDEN